MDDLEARLLPGKLKFDRIFTPHHLSAEKRNLLIIFVLENKALPLLFFFLYFCVLIFSNQSEISLLKNKTKENFY